MIRAVPIACLATTLVAGQASAQAIGAPPLPPAPFPSSSTGMMPAQGAATAQAAPAAPLPVLLETGAGRLLTLPAAASAVLAADPKVARVQPASPTSIFVIGVSAGRTNIMATAEDGTAIVEYAVTVRGGAEAAPSPAPAAPAPAAGSARPSAAAIEAALRQMGRGTGSVRVRSVPNGYVLSGTAGNPAEAQRLEAIARGFMTEDQVILNEIEILSSTQVNLRVRVMEISRDVTRNLGFNWQALAATGEFVLGLKSGASAAYAVSSILGGTGATLPPGRLAVGASRAGKFDVNSIIDALAQDRLATILAEPNLTAQSGEAASFLAGGEFPVPVGGGLGTISIQFKQFGVSLGFVPTVLGPDRVNLRVRPEVSELSDNGAISLPVAGLTIRVPALAVRRAETTIELGSGQSFAIAGLLTRNTAQVMDGIAGAGEIPVLGALFRSTQFRRAETELVIIVTPYLVRPVSDPTALQGPTDGFKPATDLDRVLFMRQVARGGSAARPLRAVPQDSGFLME